MKRRKPLYTAKLNVVVLWEDEIRAASKALKALSDHVDLEAFNAKDPKALDEYTQLVYCALDACYAALYHSTAFEGASLVITSAPKSLAVFKDDATGGAE